MDLAKNLIRMTVRAFYSTEHVLVVDALAIHSTLPDTDLATALGMPRGQLRKLCGTLKADGLVSSQIRGEKKEGAPPVNPTKDGQPVLFKDRERLQTREWYYLNFHHAIDCLKYRMHKLSRHIEAIGAPTTEKKGRSCPRCKSSYNELEVMDNISAMGEFLCHKCQHVLDEVDEADLGENESMKRLNDQLSRMVDMMRQIDSTDVPENDFEAALSHHVPITRGDWNPAAKREIVDFKPSLANSKGLALAPEEITVTVLEDGDDSKITAEEAARKRAEEAKQNSLPAWIAGSTITGELTAIGYKEAAERAARDAHASALHLDDGSEEKKVNNDDDGVMDDYWAALKAEQEREKQEAAEEDDEEEDDDDDEDDFEDVVVGDSSAKADSSLHRPSISGSTPVTLSSTATDDEGPAAKRVKSDISQQVAVSAPEGTQESKNGESDEDELEFEDV